MVAARDHDSMRNSFSRGLKQSRHTLFSQQPSPFLLLNPSLLPPFLLLVSCSISLSRLFVSVSPVPRSLFLLSVSLKPCLHLITCFLLILRQENACFPHGSTLHHCIPCKAISSSSVACLTQKGTGNERENWGGEVMPTVKHRAQQLRTTSTQPHFHRFPKTFSSRAWDWGPLR